MRDDYAPDLGDAWDLAYERATLECAECDDLNIDHLEPEPYACSADGCDCPGFVSWATLERQLQHNRGGAGP